MSEIRVPKETVNDETVTVVRLPTSNSMKVVAGDPIAEIETSKANITLEADISGYIRYHCSVGDSLPINGLVASITENPIATPSGKRVQSSEELLETKDAPVFSRAALALLEREGVDIIRFSHKDFVTVSDVRALGGIEPSAADNEAPGRIGNAVITAPESGALSGGSLSSLVRLVRSDLYRYGGKSGLGNFLHNFFAAPGFRVSTLARICSYTRGIPLLRFTIHPLLSFSFGHTMVRFGIRIPLQAQIGSGFYVGHWGGIWINSGVIIGRDCNISQEVSIGSAGKESRIGHPVIGNRVFIGPGAKIAGPIRIGSNVVIAANSLVTSDVPDNSVIVGVPAKVVAKVTDENSYISNIAYAPITEPLMDSEGRRFGEV